MLLYVTLCFMALSEEVWVQNLSVLPVIKWYKIVHNFLLPIK